MKTGNLTLEFANNLGDFGHAADQLRAFGSPLGRLCRRHP